MPTSGGWRTNNAISALPTYAANRSRSAICASRSLRALVTAQVSRKLTAGSKAPRPKTVRVVAGATRAGLVEFIIEPAPAWQILEHVGEPTIAAAIAPALSPPLDLNG